MLKKGITLSVLILILAIVSACKKGEGEGGTSSIAGKVYAKNYNKTFITVSSEGYEPKADVYIIYGDDITYGDKQETNYDGSFHFKYLRKGRYKVFCYSNDSTGAKMGQADDDASPVAIVANVEITEDDKIVMTPDINILK